MSGVTSPITSSVATRTPAARTAAGRQRRPQCQPSGFRRGLPRLLSGGGPVDYAGSAALSFYVDPSGPTVDLENMRGVTAGINDEGAIAALLGIWDAANDGSDTVNHGHAAIQRVYTDPNFQGNT